MDEFLEKLQEDQRRMRKFLRTHALHFKKMGAHLAEARNRGARVFVIGEPPLDGLASVVADEYLAHLPALALDLSRPQPASVNPDAEEPPRTAREGAARQAGRHFHRGDVLLGYLHNATDRETRMVLEKARARKTVVLLVGGLGARTPDTKRLAKVRLTLPTRGIKTICESVFVTARIVARVSRAEGGAADLVVVTCETCCERVFFEEQLRGRRAKCPLCEASLRIPRDSKRREALTASPPETTTTRKRRRRLKPSVLNVPTLDVLEAGHSPLPFPEENSSQEAPLGLASREPSAPPSAEGPSFGSDILVGSDVVIATPDPDADPPPAPRPVDETASADPFAFDDEALLANLEMDVPVTGASSEDVGASGSQRLVSARFTVRQCRLRWGRGGYPDETSPEHTLVALDSRRLEFSLNPEDAAGATLQRGDELWARIEIPAFLEPILVRGTLRKISGSAGGSGEHGPRVELEFRDLDAGVRQKLERAAQSLGAPA